MPIPARRCRLALALLILLVHLGVPDDAVANSFSVSGGGCGSVVSDAGSTGVSFERNFSSSPGGIGSCNAFTRARADADSIGARVGLGNDRATGFVNAQATSVVDDFIIFGPGSSVTANFKFVLTGSTVLLSVGNAFPSDPSAVVQSRGRYRAFATVASAPRVGIDVANRTFDPTSVFMLDQFSVVLETGPISVPVGVFFAITQQMILDADVSMAINGGLGNVGPGLLTGSASLGFFDSFGLDPSGPVVTFAEPGFSLSSASAGIENSRFLSAPEPSSALMVGLSLAAIGRLRARRARAV